MTRTRTRSLWLAWQVVVVVLAFVVVALADWPDWVIVAALGFNILGYFEGRIVATYRAWERGS